MSALTLNLDTVHLTDEQFYQLCQNNCEFNFEITAKGVLIIMPPGGGDSGNREAELIIDLGIWNRQTKLGFTFSSSTVFKLPNGANRSPDVAWIKRERWEALTPEQRRKFPPIAPDFVIELRSATDDLEMLREKMQEYMDAGVNLGWLINPQQQQAEIYRSGKKLEVRNLPTELSGENLLPGFMLNLSLYLYP
ncbi:MAG: Uma2 family endonuclease [Okeania sp. SIO2G4]|uniref:Uma2 family endonuclease n=1 Tax=unclassified Okeania TaxID=2634635 RepID=UPI0013BD3EC2|nr:MULTISPECIES: Uma2 family endonuclease [unclassified Okeania]NEP05162.1 Uma2 family endonuclease [Okeania sp. SIO4D6]NEP39148.1 Uma2 family endonuclease [Okeania sp. SIO2H7]NEP74599.1 Uma2 family endonuclease [Okeania sp. SIO2G5]NEP95660.1 Uma2 family endonuclease [Okeania sp. SIO2F5]NEQ93456.1 Uma2 family endonuclease [Okeania sp. SIO2G4]